MGIFESSEAHACADNAHESASGYESGSEQRAFIDTGFVQGRVVAAAAYVPANESAHDKRRVEFQRDEHTESESKGRYFECCEQKGYYGSGTVKYPWRGFAGHHRFYHGCHCICLWRYQASVGRVEAEHRLRLLPIPECRGISMSAVLPEWNPASILS